MAYLIDASGAETICESVTDLGVISDSVTNLEHYKELTCN